MPGTRKLGRTTDHRLAMLRSLTTSLLLNGKIETTEAKNAKIARNTKKDIKIGIKAAATGETEYSKFKLYIDDKKVTENDTMEYTVSTTDMELDIGTHTVMVCAYDETIDQWFSHIFAITITN